MIKIILLSLLFTSLYANNFVNKKMSITTIDSTSHEYVYKSNNPSYKLSELIWEVDNVKLLGLQFDYLISKDSFFQFSYKQNISNDAQMDDYDWMIDDISDWSHWSTHPNTVLDNYTILDLSIHHRLESKSSIEQNVIFGYKNIEKSFRAYDGSYIYTEDRNATNNYFRNDIGTFSGLSISYDESFDSVYMGISLKKRFPHFTISGIFKYSPIVYATNRDNHHFRFFVNENEFEFTTMTDIGLEVEYPIKKNISIVYNYQNVNYQETRGTTTRTYYKDGKNSYGNTIPKGTVSVYSGAGISNSYSSSSLALVMRF